MVKQADYALAMAGKKAAEDQVSTKCDRCTAAVILSKDEHRLPLCPTCWTAYRKKLKTAMKKGFRLGSKEV